MWEKQIDPAEYGVDLNKPALEVAESHVYKGLRGHHEVAFKLYPSLPHGRIKEYVDVTNSLAKKVNSRLQISLALEDGVHDYVVQLVPVALLGMVERTPCTISQFIYGDTLADIEPHYLSNNWDLGSDEPLGVLSQTLSLLAKKSNIAVIPWNVKPYGNQLFVTDICGSISSLR